MKKILIVVTNHATLGPDKEKNGTYAPELTHALHEFIKAGFTFEIASLQGGSAPIYGGDTDDGVNLEILAKSEVKSRIEATTPISDLNPSEFDGVFYPGGYGVLYDLAKNEISGNLTAKIFEQGGVVGAVCHGPAGLLPVYLSNGDNIMKNIAVTAFTREEEIDFNTIDKIPYLLEESLTMIAGQYNKKAPWQEFVIVEGRVITGQNPQSASGVGRAMVTQLQ